MTCGVKFDSTCQICLLQSTGSNFMNSKYLKTLDNGQQRGALTNATVYIRTDSSRSDVRALVHSGPLTADQQYTLSTYTTDTQSSLYTDKTRQGASDHSTHDHRQTCTRIIT